MATKRFWRDEVGMFFEGGKFIGRPWVMMMPPDNATNQSPELYIISQSVSRKQIANRGLIDHLPSEPYIKPTYSFSTLKCAYNVMIVLDFRHLTSRPPAVTEFYEFNPWISTVPKWLVCYDFHFLF